MAAEGERAHAPVGPVLVGRRVWLRPGRRGTPSNCAIAQTCSMIITAAVSGSRALKMCGASPG
jgi:hypothetical protein